MSAKTHNDIVDQSDLILFCGLICCGDFIYLSKECCGCSGKCECCCLRESCCCKIGKCYPIGCCEAKDTLCSCGCGFYECAYIEPTTFMKSLSQFCCWVTQFAIPNDDEVPMVCACCGLACYPRFGCCEKMNTLRGERPKAPISQDKDFGTSQKRPKAVVYPDQDMGTSQDRPKANNVQAQKIEIHSTINVN